MHVQGLIALNKFIVKQFALIKDVWGVNEQCRRQNRMSTIVNGQV